MWPFLNPWRFNELLKPVGACRTVRNSRITNSLQWCRPSTLPRQTDHRMMDFPFLLKEGP